MKDVVRFAGHRWVWMLVLMALYLFPVTTLVSGDTLASIFGAASMADGQAGFLDNYPVRTDAQGNRYSWALETVDGRIVSGFGVGVSLLIAPFLLLHKTLIGVITFESAIFWAKMMAALSVALAFFLWVDIARRLTSRRRALLLGLVYALGTSAYGIASQEPWHQSANQCLLLLPLWAFLRPSLRLSGRAFLFAAMVLVFLVRPTSLLLLAALLLPWWRVRRGRVLLALAGLTIGVFAQAWLNTRYFGAPWVFGQSIMSDHSVALRGLTSPWVWNPFPGLLGLLTDPSRGLLVYSPFLLFLLAWLRPSRLGCDPDPARQALRRRVFLSSAGLFTVALALYAFRWEWTGGYCWGPRFLTDAAPFLMLLLIPVVESLRRRWTKALFVLLVVSAIGIQALGAVSDIYGPESWNGSSRRQSDRDPTDHSPWDLSRPPQIIHHLRFFKWEEDLHFNAIPDPHTTPEEDAPTP